MPTNGKDFARLQAGTDPRPKAHTTTIQVTVSFDRDPGVSDADAQIMAEQIVRDRLGVVGIDKIEVIEHESTGTPTFIGG